MPSGPRTILPQWRVSRLYGPQSNQLLGLAICGKAVPLSRFLTSTESPSQ